MSTISTPPPTTLDTPSPTEIGTNEPEAGLPPPSQDIMPKTSKPIYLVVATALSPPLGIGHKGTLPWPQIRTDMTFFRKVTSNNPTTGSKNAVIMGRKTWESIPPKFRPLPGRVNVILTRADSNGIYAMGEQINDEFRRKEGLQQSGETRFTIDNNDDGCLFSLTRKGDRCPTVQITDSLRRATDIGSHAECEGVYCIGGAEIYGMMLRERELRDRVRILQTQVRKLDGSAFECDTFFPEELREGVDGWKEAGAGDVKQWIGMDLPQGEKEWIRDEKADVEIKVVGWSRQ